eukprot:5163084-Lingulodinium_polyedra.AAC.1
MAACDRQGLAGRPPPASALATLLPQTLGATLVAPVLLPTMLDVSTTLLAPGGKPAIAGAGARAG